MKTKTTIYNYPYEVIRAVELWYENNDNGISEEEIKKLEPAIVLDVYLEWEGIIGYTHNILSIMTARKEVK